ncbi:MAG: hypothetical protein KAS63_00640 [Candidatus Heimdallarchaeota archaeon]|nr:hypothetical protein [Candidatus Heimdallarchaeota archaeon]MCK4953850.1 hypothetical protein [Candidatus Heimdallarchaeota archaeon]
MKDKKCKEHDCGEFTGGEDKEAKLKHLKECKENLMMKIEKIDATIKDLE